MENTIVKVKCIIVTQYVGCNCDFCENYALVNILRKTREALYYKLEGYGFDFR
jgi:hypothetical protein